MQKWLVYTAMSLILFTNTACAEDAKSPVASNGNGNGTENSTGNGEEEHLELMALTYSGKDPFGADCSLYISAIEEEHEGEHHHEVVAKVGYNIHGETPLDTVVEFHRYSLDTNTYYPIDSNQADTNPVLVSAILDDETMAIDLNKLVEYEQEGHLVQSLRADFIDMDFDAFESAMDEVLEDNSKFATNQAVLDQLQRSVLKISHGGHYDAVACSNFSLTEMKTVEFDLDGDHGGGHGHEH